MIGLSFGNPEREMPGLMEIWCVFLFFFCSFLPSNCLEMDGVTNGEEPVSWDELYNINLMPSELFLKFRKEIQGVRIGLNFEVYYHACNFLN